jgi:hypothetical protein
MRINKNNNKLYRDVGLIIQCDTCNTLDEVVLERESCLKWFAVRREDRRGQYSKTQAAKLLPYLDQREVQLLCRHQCESCFEKHLTEFFGKRGAA